MAEQLTDEVSMFSEEDLPEWWQKMWGGMPEFVQDDMSPFKTIMIHFRDREDFKRFAQLLGQVLTVDTKSTWFPEMHPANLKVLKYVDEKKPSEPLTLEDCQSRDPMGD